MVLFPPALTVRLQTLEPRTAVRIPVSQPHIGLYELAKAKLTASLPGIGAKTGRFRRLSGSLEAEEAEPDQPLSGPHPGISAGFLGILQLTGLLS